MEGTSHRHPFLDNFEGMERTVPKVQKAPFANSQDPIGRELGAARYLTRGSQWESCNNQWKAGPVSVSSSGFGRSQTSLLLFSGIALSIKFLDITKFGTFELGDNSDKNLAVGAIAVVVMVFALVSSILLIHEIVEKYIDDGRINPIPTPDFSKGENSINPTILELKFFVGYVLFFTLKVFPIIFGIFVLVITRYDIFYFFNRMWGLMLSGGQP